MVAGLASLMLFSNERDPLIDG